MHMPVLFFLWRWRSSYFATSFRIWETDLEHAQVSQHWERSSSLRAEPSQTCCRGQSTPGCGLPSISSVNRALLRWKVKGLRRIPYTALQHKCVSFTDAPSNAGSLNESPPLDKFGSIKNSLVYLHNNEPLSGTFLNFCSFLSLPTFRPEYLFYVVAYSHS